jgi:ribosome-associated protein
MARIRIADDVFLEKSAVEVRFTRSGGPGGQKVNTSDTAVQLFLDLESSGFPGDMLRRLREIAGGRIGSDGRLMVECSTHRSQSRNRKLAMSRLVKLLRRAARKPKKRRRTRPPRAAREKRLREKRKQSQKKKLRKKPDPSDY